MGPAAIVVYKHPLRHTSHPSSEAEMEDPHLAALQNQLTDSKRRLAVACTQMSEFAGAFILLILIHILSLELKNKCLPARSFSLSFTASPLRSFEGGRGAAAPRHRAEAARADAWTRGCGGHAADHPHSGKPRTSLLISHSVCDPCVEASPHVRSWARRRQRLGRWRRRTALRH